jgi:hypothetical protein
MDQPDYYGSQRRRGWIGLTLAVLLAFALGIAASLRFADDIAAFAGWRTRPAATALAAPAAAPPRVQPVIVQPAPPSDPALEARVVEVETQIDGIEARAEAASSDAERAEGLLLAFAARRALDRGQPLGFLEGMLRERFGGRDAASVAQVIAAAQRPTTLVSLQDGLEALRPRLVARSAEEGAWTGLKRELGSLFVLRRADTPSQAPSDRFDRATRALQQGHADVAATEVARMPGAPGAADWLAQARRYTLARNALDRLETAALLAPPSRPATP